MELPQENLIKSVTGTFTTSDNGNIVLDIENNDNVVVIGAICVSASTACVVLPYKNLSASKWCCRVINVGATTVKIVANTEMEITYYYMNL